METTDIDWAPRRSEGLEINEVADGYIVYQPGRDRIHYLNHTAVVILELCTGAITAGDIARCLGDAYRMASPPTAEVCECLGKLLDEEIVQ